MEGFREQFMTVRIEYAPGKLPRFGDQSVIFFANLLALFYGNEGATQELEAKVGGIDTYGGRLCPLLNLLFTGPHNLLVLEAAPDETLLHYFDELGLDLPEVVIVHHNRYHCLRADLRAVRSRDEDPDDRAISRIAESCTPWVDGFVTDQVLADVAEILGKRTIISPEVSRRGNNKLLLHQFLEEQGLPIFDTEIATGPAEIATASRVLMAKGYRRAVIKAQIGATGIGMLKFDTSDPRCDEVPPHMFYEGPCLVQGWLDEELSGVSQIGSPSMQMFLDDSTLWIYDVTEQILSAQSVHEGNLSPPLYWRNEPDIEPRMRDQAIAVGRWLHDTGYRGTASADFLIIRRHGRLEVRLCEVNARVTGATYPSVLARRYCPGGFWLMRNLFFDPPIRGRDLLDALRSNRHLYTGQPEGGLLPINFNTDHAGLTRKAQFLCFAADADTCLNCLIQAADVLPVKWTYDRD
jgi:hypothetical protein